MPEYLVLGLLLSILVLLLCVYKLLISNRGKQNKAPFDPVVDMVTRQMIEEFSRPKTFIERFEKGREEFNLQFARRQQQGIVTNVTVRRPTPFKSEEDNDDERD